MGFVDGAFDVGFVDRAVAIFVNVVPHLFLM